MEHRDTKKIGKPHASHLSPYTKELLPFFPIDGVDNRYGQIYTTIKSDPYMNTGIKGFQPSQPFKTFVHAATNDVGSDVIFPTMARMNAELFEWNEK